MAEQTQSKSRVSLAARRRGTSPRRNQLRRSSALFICVSWDVDAQTKETQTMISSEQTEVRIDTRICIEDLVDMEIDQLKDDDKRGKQPGNGTQEPVKKTARVRETSKSEMNVGSCSVSNGECSGTSRCPVGDKTIDGRHDAFNTFFSETARGRW